MLDKVLYYIALYEIKNYRQCAANFGIQTSTLSKYITGLEKELGALLIVRTSRRFEVTEFGEYIYNNFKHIPSFVKNTIDVYHKKIKKESRIGTLNIAIGPDISYETISPYIGSFMNQNPNITLNINYLPHVSKWPNPNISLVLTVLTIEGDNLDHRFIRKDYFRLYCSSNYAAQHSIPTCVKELKNHKVIGFAPHHSIPMEYYKLRNTYTNEEYILDFRQNRLNTNSALQMKQIGINSDYIFPLPDSLISNELNQGKLINILPDWVARDINIYIVSKKQITQTEQLFIDFIFHCMN